MDFYFSRRHDDALKKKKLKPYLPQKLRISVKRTLEQHSEWGGMYNEENLTFYAVEEALKTFYGEEQIKAYDSNDQLVPVKDVGVLIERGYPPKVLDAIEVWFDKATEEKVFVCERELNSLFEIHSSPWRISNGKFILVNSEYIQAEIMAKTKLLMQQNAIVGGLDEFQNAVSSLTEGNCKEAVVSAHKSVESVMKSVLGIKEHRTFGRLLDKCIKSGLIPEYYKGFYKNFNELALGSVKERNQPGGGHGQGKEIIEIPRNLAEFTVHLSSVINLFLIKHGIELHSDKAERSLETSELI